MDYSFNDWSTLKLDYEYEKTERAKYSAVDSRFSEAADFLAYNTDSYTQTLRATASISTVNLYMKKEFILPGAIRFIYQTVFDGRNAPKIDRYELELNMFF